MAYTFYNLSDPQDQRFSRDTFDTPKFRSGVTGIIISESDTEAMQNAIGEEGLHLLVKNEFLIEVGEWKSVPDTRTWKEICEYGETVKAIHKYREESNSTLREARQAVEEYKELLKKKYGRRE